MVKTRLDKKIEKVLKKNPRANVYYLLGYIRGSIRVNNPEHALKGLDLLEKSLEELEINKIF